MICVYVKVYYIEVRISVHVGQSIKPPECCDQKERGGYRYCSSLLVLEKCDWCVHHNFHYRQTVHISIYVYAYICLSLLIN